MNSVEYYVRQWAKREKEDIDTLVKYTCKECEVANSN